MAVVETIGNGAKEALNVGLGIVKTLEAGAQDLQAGVQKFQADVEKTYAELVARGAADSSEVAVGIRTNLDKGIAAVRDVQTKVEGAISK